MATHFERIGGKLLAGDSTKFRAQNSKKNNFNEKKTERHLAYIDEKLAQYKAELDQADEDTEKFPVPGHGTVKSYSALSILHYWNKTVKGWKGIRRNTSEGRPS